MVMDGRRCTVAASVGLDQWWLGSLGVGGSLRAFMWMPCAFRWMMACAQTLTQPPLCHIGAYQIEHHSRLFENIFTLLSFQLPLPRILEKTASTAEKLVHFLTALT